MHELTICRNILNIVEEKAKQDACRCVKKIYLEIGDLAGIEVEALRFSFPIAASRSIAQNASLEIIRVEGRAWCYDCQKEVVVKMPFDACLGCGQYHYRVMQGKELRIVRMEVE